MLNTSGYFSNVLCPFFKSGYCRRNHCHFKHEKSAQCGNSYWTSADDSEEVIAPKYSNTSIPQSLASYETKPITYVPTPVNQCNTKPILKPPAIKQEAKMPEYTPTPISKLKLLHNDPEYSSQQSRKRKKYEEYQPEFVKGPTKRKVSFNVPNDVGDDNVVISSDDDNDDVGPEATFSDDDLNDNDSAKVKVVKVVESIKVKSEPIENEEVSQFSIVDKILGDVKKNEVLFSGCKPLPKVVSNKSLKKEQIHFEMESSVSSKTKSTSDTFSELEKPCKTSSEKIDKTQKHSSENKRDGKHKSEPKQLKHKSDRLQKIEKAQKSSTKSHSISDKNKTSKSSSLKLPKQHENEKESSSKHHKDSSSKHHVKDKDSSSTKASDSKPEKIKSKDKVAKSKAETRSEKSETKSKHVDKQNSLKLEKYTSKKETDGSSSKPHKHGEEKKKSSKLQDKKVTSSNSVKKSPSLLESSPIKSLKMSNNEKRAKPSSKSKEDLPVGKTKIKSFSITVSTGGSCLEEQDSPMKRDTYSDSDVDMVPDDVMSDDSESECDPTEECWRIWQEQHGNSSESKLEKTPEKQKKAVDIDSKKARIAHTGSSSTPTKRPMSPKKQHLNPKEIMYNRFITLNNRYSNSPEKKVSSPFSRVGDVTKNKISIAPSSSYSNLIAAVTQKKECTDLGLNVLETMYTPPQSKKGIRIARVPSVNVTKQRPCIPSSYGNKVPVNVRQQSLNRMIDECLKFCDNEDQAYALGLEEESNAYARSSSKSIYYSHAANTLSKLRTRAKKHAMKQSNPAASSPINKNSKVSHQTMLEGSRAQKLSFSMKIGKPAEAPITDTLVYDLLQQYLLTGEQLVENGFPLPHPIATGRAVISGIYARRTVYCNDLFKRICSRCQKTYYVDKDGDYVKEEECDYHWGRIFKRRIAGSFEGRYTCCQGDSETSGCCVGHGHVFDGSENHVLTGYVKTLPKSPPPTKFYGIYAVDCEMCYTAAGIELTRVSVINRDMRTVYESFVKPEHRVLDYNTRFSGITEDDLMDVKTSIRDVQAVLLCIFCDKTILIGHSLESDLKALKLIHKTVVDTSMVFPHKLGLPYKRALKTLMAEKCNKIIQNNVEGHDSTEDAAACMELMLLKIKEDLKHASR